MYLPIDSTAAYVDHRTGNMIATGNEAEFAHATRLARSYTDEMSAIEKSDIGRIINEETKGRRRLEIIASGVADLESSLPGALQATTVFSDGTGTYTRDAKHYERKLEELARLYDTDREVMHTFANIHEYVHGQGVLSERDVHEICYQAYDRARTEAKDPKERELAETLLHVETSEIARRYSARPKRRSSRVPLERRAKTLN